MMSIANTYRPIIHSNNPPPTTSSHFYDTYGSSSYGRKEDEKENGFMGGSGGAPYYLKYRDDICMDLYSDEGAEMDPRSNCKTVKVQEGFSGHLLFGSSIGWNQGISLSLSLSLSFVFLLLMCALRETNEKGGGRCLFWRLSKKRKQGASFFWAFVLFSLSLSDRSRDCPPC